MVMTGMPAAIALLMPYISTAGSATLIRIPAGFFLTASSNAANSAFASYESGPTTLACTRSCSDACMNPALASCQ